MYNDLYFALTEKGVIRGTADEIKRGGDIRLVHKIKGGLPVTVSVWDFTHKAEKENFDTCKRISDELDEYASGSVARCPNCGEVHDISAAGEKFCCPDCGDVSDIDCRDICGMWDYFDDFLDIDYITNYRKEYKACRVLVAFGGPNIYIDTYSGEVALYWWSDRASYPLSRDTMDVIDEWAEDYFNCM